MSNLLSRLFLPTGEKYAIGRWASWMSPYEDDGGNSLAGVNVNRETAVAVSAVYACARIITGTVATLPIDTLQRQNGARVGVDRPNWLDHPIPRNPNMTRVIHFSQVISSMLFDGNAFTYALPSVYDPQELHVLDPRNVDIKMGVGGAPVYRVRSRQSGYAEYTPDNIIHTPLPLFLGDSMRGLSPVEAARQGIAVSLASERFGAKLFENGTVMSGVIKIPGPLAQEAQDEIREKWAARYGGVKNAHKPGILVNGAEWQPLGITPDQAQFLATRQFQAEETARLFGVPPAIIGIVTPGAASHNSVEQQNIQFVTFTLRNIVESIEAAYQRLIPGDTTFVKFNMAGLLRADFKSRTEGYALLLQNKVATRDEIRAKEDWAPVNDAGWLETPNNNSSDPRYEAVGALVRAGFEPEAALRALGLPSIAHTGLPPVTVQPAYKIGTNNP